MESAVVDRRRQDFGLIKSDYEWLMVIEEEGQRPEDEELHLERLKRCAAFRVDDDDDEGEAED
jgi:hypothetical protein